MFITKLTWFCAAVFVLTKLVDGSADEGEYIRS